MDEKGNITKTGSIIKDISLYYSDSNKGASFGLYIRDENTIMLHVGEKYYYMGFYELSKT